MVRPVIVNPKTKAALQKIVDNGDIQTIFAIPHYNGHFDGKEGYEAALTEIRYLGECLESLSNQVRYEVDPETGTVQVVPETRFAVVVVNDASPSYEISSGATPEDLLGTDPSSFEAAERGRFELRHAFMREIAQYSDRINVIAIEQKLNGGIGNARNPVIVLADELGIPSVSFVDHDDINDPRRVAETIKTFSDPEVTMVYSSFYPIDSLGQVRRYDEMEPGITKYARNVNANKPQGYHVWQDLFTDIDYVNLPSTTAVRTGLMVKHLFDRPLCEDNSRWPGLMAEHGKLAFMDTLTGYRILPGASTASRAANAGFFDVAYVAADLAGMHAAMNASGIADGRRLEIFARWIERSIAYNMHKPQPAVSRPDIAGALMDLRDGKLSFDAALCQERFLERVNEHAERLGMDPTEMKPNVRRELEYEADGIPVESRHLFSSGTPITQQIMELYFEEGIDRPENPLDGPDDNLGGPSSAPISPRGGPNSPGGTPGGLSGGTELPTPADGIQRDLG